MKELWCFLGLKGYYIRFVRNYGLIACPFTNRTKNNAFHLTISATEAFEKLNEVHTLRLSKPFIIQSGASSKGIGVILFHDSHLISCFIKDLSYLSCLKWAYEQELLVVVLTLHKMEALSIGSSFLHKNISYTLKYLLE